MIEVKDGTVHIKGSNVQLLSDLTAIKKILVEDKILTKERDEFSWDIANKSDEEMKKEALGFLHDMLNFLEHGDITTDTFKKMFGDLTE